MKKILWILLFSLTFSVVSAQTYKVGVMFAMNQFIKFKVQVIITDSTISTIHADDPPLIYKIINRANSNIYVTDGTMMHIYSIIETKGKTKGFNYDTYILFTPDYRQSNLKMGYYAIKE